MNFVKAEPQAATTKKYNDWESINDDNNKIDRKSHTYYMFPISDNVQCPLAMMERSSARFLLSAVQIKDLVLPFSHMAVLSVEEAALTSAGLKRSCSKESHLREASAAISRASSCHPTYLRADFR